jgi:hypothetical protein
MYLSDGFVHAIERFKMHGVVPARTYHADTCGTTQVGVAFIEEKGWNRLAQQTAHITRHFAITNWLYR